MKTCIETFINESIQNESEKKSSRLHKEKGNAEFHCLDSRNNQYVETFINESIQIEVEKTFSRLHKEKGNAVFYCLDLRNNQYASFSNSSVNLLGYSSDELRRLGLEGFMRRIHPEDLIRINAAVKKDVEKEILPGIGYRFLHKDTSFRTVYEYRYVFYDKSENPMLLIGRIEPAEFVSHVID